VAITSTILTLTLTLIRGLILDNVANRDFMWSGVLTTLVLADNLLDVMPDKLRLSCRGGCLIHNCTCTRVSRVSRVWVTLAVMVRVSRVSVMVSVRDSVK